MYVTTGWVVTIINLTICLSVYQLVYTQLTNGSNIFNCRRNIVSLEGKLLYPSTGDWLDIFVTFAVLVKLRTSFNNYRIIQNRFY